MKVLGIETSCDETAAAIVCDEVDPKKRILSQIIFSQIHEHEAYGGVVPEVAARSHVEKLDQVIKQSLKEAGLQLDEVDAIAATAGPGLIGALIVGLTTGKALALALNKPFYAVNHLEGHALTPTLVYNVPFPHLLLLVSGGHSQFVEVNKPGSYDVIGSTLDDAAGEAFDKVAKMLSLPYPGGPEIEKRAKLGNSSRFSLPRPMLGRAEPMMSFSGLKTAVRLLINDTSEISKQDTADICASFQAAVADIFFDRCNAALKASRNRNKLRAMVVAGGVAANLKLRQTLQSVADKEGIPLFLPPVSLCADNAAMIAWAAITRMKAVGGDPLTFAPRARWPLDEMSWSMDKK